MIELKDYQREAVGALRENVERLLKSSQSELCVFQAPTGSGKTLMVSELLRELVRDRKDNRRFSFIWISVRMLHEQSKEKLEKYYENDRALLCSYFEDLEDRRIGENEILFINWHSINKRDINIFVRENETDNNLNSIVQHTREDGRDIVLIIDESHHTASSAKSQDLIQIIAPKVTIKVSATPHPDVAVSAWVKVNLDDVKGEQMIKSEISINPEFTDAETGAQSTDEFVIGEALKRRSQLLAMYKETGSNVNPLVLIQLPDRREGQDDKRDEVVSILSKHRISEQDGNLAIWLSEEKSELLPSIERNDNEIEVLIFKQAIALGWDCPRASILVIFRESKSFVFTIQTIGRIMRMPELKYYDEMDLNRGYIYTNLSNLEIEEDYAKDYVTTYTSTRKNEKYSELGLPSIFLKRQRERTRLSSEFISIFMEVAKEADLRGRIRLDTSKIVNPIMADGTIKDADHIGEVEHKGTLQIQLTDFELQLRFDRFVRESCSPFAPVDSSDRLKGALYTFFEKELGIEKYDPQVQKIVLGAENIQLFMDLVTRAKELYTTEVVEQLGKTRELQRVEKWEVPLSISYNSLYRQRESPNSIMRPLYVRQESSGPEERFMNALDQSKRVAWWFRNGESEIKYFAVFYEDEGYSRAFYPDFVVKFKDGSVGIFDTKGGITALTKEAGPRAHGLHTYIQDQNPKGRKVWGGIVIQEDHSWLYNDQEDYSYDPKNLSKWKVLNLD